MVLRINLEHLTNIWQESLLQSLLSFQCMPRHKRIWRLNAHSAEVLCASQEHSTVPSWAHIWWRPQAFTKHNFDLANHSNSEERLLVILGDSWFLVSEGSIMMIMVSTNAQLALHRWAPLPVQFSSQPAATGRRHAHPESAIPCQANLWHSWHSSEDTKSEKASNRFQNFHLFFQ